MGRGKDRPHRHIDRTADGVPVLGFDFFLIGEESEDGTVPAVAMRDSLSKQLHGHLLPGKGLDHDWTAQQLKEDLEELGYRRVSLRCDKEPAIVALAEKAKRLSSIDVMVETAPKADKNANGAAERAVQALEGQVRTLKIEVEERVQGKIPAKHPVPHAADVVSKFELKQSGLTAHHYVRGRPYRGVMSDFGRQVL